MEVPDILRIDYSPIHGYGIFANETLEPGLVLGPYKGEKKYGYSDTDYAWNVDPENGEGESWMVDGMELDKSNYLRYVNDPFGSKNFFKAKNRAQKGIGYSNYGSEHFTKVALIDIQTPSFSVLWPRSDQVRSDLDPKSGSMPFSYSCCK